MLKGVETAVAMKMTRELGCDSERNDTKTMVASQWMRLRLVTVVATENVMNRNRVGGCELRSSIQKYL
ncbi:hypothetical protein HanRHA438_Chr03g0112201 [Helianthus annuus]|nr:hypothetical protein HanRHA438_Chr03g0112201 [Helianthus annuus]